MERLKIAMDLNVPVVMRIAGVIVWPNDPKKDYGPSVHLVGTAEVDGEWVPAVTYAKGKAWAALKALATAGVTTAHEKEWDDPTSKVNVPTNENLGAVTLLYSKRHGDAYATFSVTPLGEQPKMAPYADPYGNKPSGPSMGTLPGDPAPTEDVRDDKRNALVTAYRALYASNVKWLSKIAPESEMPFDAASVNAITYSMWGTMKDKGLV